MSTLVKNTYSHTFVYSLGLLVSSYRKIVFLHRLKFINSYSRRITIHEIVVEDYRFSLTCKVRGPRLLPI